MSQGTQELSEDEMERLSDFLMARIDDDENTTDKNEGVLDVSELDGFLTAIVSGPNSIPPTEWLPALWGDYPPQWKSDQEFMDIVSMIIRHMNAIADCLMESPQDYEPLFLENTVGEKTYDIVDEWCHGYTMGIALDAEAWMDSGPEMTGLISPILSFGHGVMDGALEKMSDDEIEDMQQQIAPNARIIHAYWLVGRSASNSASRPTFLPMERAAPAPRVGRNDLCPCGSGKKYKKCCLH